MISSLLKQAADFFEANPHQYTNEYVALERGMRTNYTNPLATQWDIIGILGKLYWEQEHKCPIPLVLFRRMARAFREANEMELRPQESTFILYMSQYSDSVIDVIQALRRASNYAKKHGMDEPLDLTPPPPPIPPRRGGFVL